MSNSGATTTIMTARGVQKTYHLDAVDVPVLKGVDLEIRRGEFLAIVGSSGSGKSTLLHLLGALDVPDVGSIAFEGIDMVAGGEMVRDRLRNERFGFVFQFYHLLPELTVLENVLMPRLVGSSVTSWLGCADESENDGRRLLEQLGLADRANHLPSQLSGGERQRAAIGRAMINRPAILFADEPTGNLDAKTGEKILDLLLDIHRGGQTLVMVTHDPSVAKRADRTIRLVDGRIATDA